MASQINASNSGFGGIVSTGDSSGVLQLQTTGTTAVTIDTSQRAAFVAGTAALPAITTTGDTNTGMFFPAADTIAFAEGGTEAMRLDSSGNVGIGTTSPAAKLNVATGSGTLAQNIVTIKGGGASGSFSGLSVQSNTGDEIFNVNNLSYHVTMGTVAGNLLVGTTTARGKITVFSNSNSSATPTVYFANEGGTGVFASFGDLAGIVIGTIARSGSSTNYNTSSDYRLKENIVPMTGALDKVALLKPVTYKWKIDGSDGQGFIAHELQEIVPDCVTGEKDAVDNEGNPIHQGIDTSFLVATLTAAIQEQQTIINDLKARIETLESK